MRSFSQFAIIVKNKKEKRKSYKETYGSHMPKLVQPNHMSLEVQLQSFWGEPCLKMTLKGSAMYPFWRINIELGQTKLQNDKETTIS